MEDPTIAHEKQKLLHPNVVWIVIGCIAILVAGAWFVMGGKGGAAGGSSNISPLSGPEGTTVTVSYPSTVTVPAGSKIVFKDAGEHGFVAVKSGGGMYVSYDPTTNLSYDAAGTMSDGKLSAQVPQGVCGLVIKSAQEPTQPPKKISVTVVDPSGNPVPGVPSGTFSVECDTFTLNAKATASKDPVLPDGADSSVVTATFSVTGPAQFINGERIKPGGQKPILTTPLGLMMVHLTTDLGVTVPATPVNVKTDLNGQVTLTISSTDAGIANVRAVAQGVGDVLQQVHFPPKISGVTMIFVPPTSPTNYTLTTIPKNPKDLTIDWKFTPAPGASCGHMTGMLSGLGLVANGFYHGPEKNYPNGCPEDWEKASQITVTVTDKDGQSESKTFGARAYEGAGFTKLP